MVSTDLGPSGRFNEVLSVVTSTHLTCLDLNTLPQIWGAHHKYLKTLRRSKKLTPRHEARLSQAQFIYRRAQNTGCDDRACEPWRDLACAERKKSDVQEG